MIISVILSLYLKNIDTNDNMISYDEEKLSSKDKINTILISSLYAVLCGWWCMGLDAITELAPLISKK